MRCITLICFIILFSITIVNGQAVDDPDLSMIYSAITEIQEDGVSHSEPFTEYKVIFGYELWSEIDSFNLSSEALGIDPKACMVKLNLTATTDGIKLDQGICALKPIDQQILGGVTGNPQRSFTIALKRSEINNIVADKDYFPDGEINLILYSDLSAIQDIIGGLFGAKIITTEGQTNIVYDVLPDNYGDLSSTAQNFLHMRLTDVKKSNSVISPDYHTSFRFWVFGEILNRGPKIEQFREEGCAETLYSETKIIGADLINPHTICGGDVPYRIRNASTSVEYFFNTQIIFHDQVIDTIPDGTIDLFLDAALLETNVFHAQIIIENGHLEFKLPDLPDFWEDYPLVAHPLSSRSDVVLDDQSELNRTSLLLPFSVFLISLVYIKMIHKPKT